MPRILVVAFLFAALFARAEEPAPAPPELILQTGHFPDVRHAVLSPDGRTVLAFANGGGHNDARLWNVASGRVLRHVPRIGLLKSAAWTPDGKHFLLGCGIQVELWNVAAEHEVVKYPAQGIFGTNEELGVCTLSPGGRLALIPGGKGRYGALAVCETTTGRLLCMLRDWPFHILAFAGSADDTRVATFGWRSEDRGDGTFLEKGRVTVWSVEMGVPESTFDLDLDAPRPVTSLAFHPDGKRIVLSLNRTLAVRDAATGRILAEARAPEGLVYYQAAFAPGGDRFVAAAYSWTNGVATVFETATGKEVADLGTAGTALFPPSHGPHFSPDGTRLAIPDLEYKRARMRVLEWPSLRPAASLALQPHFLTMLEDIRFSDDGAALELTYHSAHPEDKDLGPRELLLGLDPLVSLHAYLLVKPEDRADHVALLRHVKERPVYPVLRSPDERRIVAVIPSGHTFMGGDRLVFYDVKKDKVTGRSRIKDGYIRTLEYSPDGRTVLASLYGKAVLLWDARTGKVVRRFTDQRALAASKEGLDWPEGLASFSPDGREVFANELGPDEKPRSVVFDAATGERKRILASVLRPGLSRPLVIAPQGGLMAVENRIFDAESGRLVRTLSDDYWAAAVSPDGKRFAFAVLSGWRIAVAIVDAATGATLATVTVLDQTDWIAVTPDGYFEGTDVARRAVSWRIGGEVFPLELYEDVYHRPGVVSDAILGKRAAAAPPPGKPPALKGDATAIDATSVTVKFTATPGSPDAPIRDLRVFVDGRDLAVVQGAPVAREDLADGAVAFTARVSFPAGKSRVVVAAVASDSAGLKSHPAVLPLLRPGAAAPAARRLFVVTVGVSDYGDPKIDLRWARADAEALAAALQDQEGRAYAKVHATVLTDAGATAPKIRAALDRLRADCGPDDVALVHFSGHGTRDPDGALYYVPHGADPADVPGTFLRWDDVVASLKNLRASSAFFLSDTCHAGAFGKDAARPSELASPLVRDARFMVFSACRDTELSLEMESLRHGAFTYAILEGLAGAADLIQDKRITVSELQTYVASRVKMLTDDHQHPHIPLMQDFDPDLVIGHVK